MVEGTDDEHVVKHICGQRGLGTIEVIHKYGGKTQLLDGIGTRLKESDITELGIILDADTNLLASWQSVADRLRASGYLISPMPSLDGTVAVAPPGTLLPRVGIWLMPNNEVPGILEDFLRFLVPDGDPLFGYVEQSIAAIPAEQVRFDSLSRPKAKMHTWLSWQAEPGRPFGQAIAARYLDPNLPSVDDFARWLRRTFFEH
jgi:hypothetical protein